MRQSAFAGVLLLTTAAVSGEISAAEKVRLFLVDSYHRGYLGSALAREGFCTGLSQYDYLDSREQIKECLDQDDFESSKVVVRTMWMDTKRKDSKPEMMEATVRIAEMIKAFQPTLLFVAEDNAANYIGNQFIDTEIPIVFWGVNNTPVKYGLVDSPEHPGHNVTGVVEVGHYEDSLELLKRLVPKVRTFAVLSDESETGRSHVKGVEELARRGSLPLELVESVSTNDFSVWRAKALELQEKVDAFFVVQYASLKDEKGDHVNEDEVVKWYLANIRIPEAGRGERQVKQGFLCTAEEPPYYKGFDAVNVAHDILTRGTKPATYPTRASKHGPLTVNRYRAQGLGITLTPELGIERYIEDSLARPATAGEQR